MSGTILGMLAETPIHVGAGRALGVVDLPVARESPTDYPYIPGSGLKGALRDRARAAGYQNIDADFGTADGAGRLLPGDGRLLLFPVRVLDGSYLWLTCPYLLERFARDRVRIGITDGFDQAVGQAVGQIKRERDTVVVTNQNPLANQNGTNGAYLEDQRFAVMVGSTLSAVVEVLQELIGHETARGRLPSQLGVVRDAEFSWFVRGALPVNARNKLDPDTKASENLWYEETLPGDTVLYSVVAARSGDIVPAEVLGEVFEGHPYLQVGGNETVGHGWLRVTVGGGAV